MKIFSTQNLWISGPSFRPFRESLIIRCSVGPTGVLHHTVYDRLPVKFVKCEDMESVADSAITTIVQDRLE